MNIRKFGLPGIASNVDFVREAFRLMEDSSKPLQQVIRKAHTETDAVVMRHTAEVNPDLLRTAELRAMINPS